MIEVNSLTKQYGKDTVVDNLSFTVPEGKITGFLGPNGSGKTTTMKMMLGLASKTKGEVLFDGKPYSYLKNPMKHVGTLLDAKAGNKSHSCENHLSWIAASNGIPSQRVREVIGIVGMDKARKKSIGSLSLGMSQRLGIATALLGDPKTLILDEPVNGLDPEGIFWIRQFLQSQAERGCTILVSSHLLREMEGLAEQLVVIGKGKKLAEASMADFINSHSENKVRVSTTDNVGFESLLSDRGLVFHREGDGFIIQDSTPQRISTIAMCNGVTLTELMPVKDSLEQVYMKMTQNSVEYRAGETHV